jgi:hypothetical protein
MDLIETLHGEATGIAQSGNTQVDFELEIFQHRLTIGGDDTVPGRQEIHGWVRPVFGKAKEVLTLEMNDESTLRFSFLDSKGNISAKGSIQSLL